MPVATAPMPKSAAIQIQRQLTVLQDCRSDGIPTIPQLNSDAGQQFFGVKGFGDIIGGAAQQKIHLVLGVHLGADNDDGNIVNLLKHLLSAETRQHQIEQNQIRLCI